MNQESLTPNHQLISQEISEYVADLQVHMTLQARNLVPPLECSGDSRQQLLRETQAELEKLVSRQKLN